MFLGKLLSMEGQGGGAASRKLNHTWESGRLSEGRSAVFGRKGERPEKTDLLNRSTQTLGVLRIRYLIRLSLLFVLIALIHPPLETSRQPAKLLLTCLPLDLVAVQGIAHRSGSLNMGSPFHCADLAWHYTSNSGSQRALERLANH
jgi:hypothetical protein